MLLSGEEGLGSRRISGGGEDGSRMDVWNPVSRRAPGNWVFSHFCKWPSIYTLFPPPCGSCRSDGKQGPRPARGQPIYLLLIGTASRRLWPRALSHAAKRYHPCVQCLVDSREILLGFRTLNMVSVSPEIRHLFIVHSRLRVWPFPVSESWMDEQGRNKAQLPPMS